MHTLTPAAIGGPAVLVLGQPFLNGLEYGLEAALTRKVSTWTSAACRGASVGLGIASMAAAVSTSIALLPAVGIGLGVGAIAGVSAKLLHHFYTRTAMGRRLAGWVAKVPGFIRKPMAWAVAVAQKVLGASHDMSSVASTSLLRTPLQVMLRVTGWPGRIATTAAMLLATSKLNAVGRGTSVLAAAGSAAIAGAAVVAPLMAAHTTVAFGSIAMGATVAVGAGVILLSAAAVMACVRFGRRLYKAGKQAVAEFEVAAAEMTEAPAPAPVIPDPAPAAPEPTVINVVTTQGEVTQVTMPTVEEIAEVTVADAPVVVDVRDQPVTVKMDAPMRGRINAKLKAKASHESISEQVLPHTPIPMAADLYSAALDRKIAEGMTPEEAVEALRPTSKRSARRAHRVG